ncbi:MAG TPA: hypothetical protein VGG76_10540 [Gemmatimonadaceae bacterium]
MPRSQRAGKALGCYIVIDQPVGVLGGKPVFWHITRFRTRQAAVKAKPASGTVIEAYSRAWLMEIAPERWRAKGGAQVAVIGPLPITPTLSYSALYMEASMRPGMKSAIHRHSGPEIWYTMSGETCLETPNGTSTGKAGGTPVIVPGDQPMELTATGKEIRRSLVLVLHDSRKPATTMEKDWKPRGTCK